MKFKSREAELHVVQPELHEVQPHRGRRRDGDFCTPLLELHEVQLVAELNFMKFSSVPRWRPVWHELRAGRQKIARTGLRTYSTQAALDKQVAEYNKKKQKKQRH